MSAWISMIDEADASADLTEAYDEARSPNGHLENVLKIHSHRPNIMRGHVRLYRSILHDEANTVPEWFQETVGAYVSMINGGSYSYANHWANARHLIGDDARSDAIEAAFADREPQRVFEGAELAALQYAEKLTARPNEMIEADVDAMRAGGFDDGQILEINQVCCYFAYANRLLNGLGVSLGEAPVGFYT